MLELTLEVEPEVKKATEEKYWVGPPITQVKTTNLEQPAQFEQNHHDEKEPNQNL